MTIDFPTTAVATLEALQDIICSTQSDVTVNIVQDIYGTLHLSNLACTSLHILGNNNRWRGAVPIDIDMDVQDGNILVGTLPSGHVFDRLMLEDELLELVRYPQHGGCTMAKLQRHAPSWTLEGARVRALHEREWGGNGYRLSSRDDKVNLEWIGNNNRGSGYKDGSLIVENVIETLCHHNQWYYDPQSAKVYIYRENAVAGKYHLQPLCHHELLYIDNCNNTAIAVDNINFCDTPNSMFSCAWDRYLRSDWAYNRSSAVTANGSSNININGCTFTDLGNNAVGIYDKCSDININNSRFTDSLTNGVLILGDKNSTYCTSCWDNDNHITHIEDGTKIGAKSDKYPSKIGINGCYFYNLGLEDKQCAAVCMSLAEHVTVKNCTIHHLPRAGINIAENAFGGHLITGNDIFDCVRETGDHGPFNSWGRDRYWSLQRFDTMGKYGNIKKPYALADMLHPNIIDSNRICGTHGFGIDLDDGSNNYVITNNLCYGVGIKLREGFYRKVTNNVIVNAPMDLHVSYCGNDDIVCDNVIINNKAFRIILPNKGNTTKIEGNTIINNVARLGKGVIKSKNTCITIRDNDKLNDHCMGLLDKDYGVPSAPKPVLNTANANVVVQSMKLGGARLSSMNEEKRSLCGAPDLNGIYVDKISRFGYLSRFELKRGDVIISIDGNPVTWNDIGKLSRCHTVTIINNQLIIQKTSK